MMGTNCFPNLTGFNMVKTWRQPMAKPSLELFYVSRYIALCLDSFAMYSPHTGKFQPMITSSILPATNSPCLASQFSSGGVA